MIDIICVNHRRKDDFEPYVEPFRPLNDEEVTSISRWDDSDRDRSSFLVSYQALPGGFTICNIIVNGGLYSGCSCCAKSDRWLPIRGKMTAFRRALESEGVLLVAAVTESVLDRTQFLKEFLTAQHGISAFPRSTVDQIISSLNSLKEEK